MMNENNIIFDNVIIRLRRYMDDNETSTFQADIRQAPISLQGGPFRADLEQLDDFHELFSDQVEISDYFYYYTTPPTDSDLLLQQMARDLAKLRDKFYDLLPLSFRQQLPHLIQHIFRRGRGIRLVIEASASDPTDRLLNLPWEILFSNYFYTAPVPRVLIVRRLLDAARHSPLDMVPPFNLVHMMPNDPDAPMDPDWQQLEGQIIPAAITPGNYTLVAAPGSVEGLLDAMRVNRPQIIHFSGHGERLEAEDGREEQSYLCFIKANGQSQWVTGEQLSHLLSAMPGVQLIVLIAGSSSTIALDLLYSGFPYVVAMQSDISQEAAKHFVRAFYHEFQQQQNIEYAVAAGRFAIATHLPGAVDSCLPVLYTNVGLVEKSSLVQSAEYIGQWLQRVDNLLPIILVLGALHLLVGLLLWLSGESPPLPDTDLIVSATGWLVVLPPFLAVWLARQLPIPEDWPLSRRLILLSHLLGSAALSLSSLILLIVWFFMVLFVALGIWGSLSTVGQILLLIPLLLITICLSCVLTYRSGLKFITTAQIVQDMPWSERIAPPFAGYTTLLISLYLISDSFDLFTSPEGNLWIGTFFLGASYLLHNFRSELEEWQDAPFNI